MAGKNPKKPLLAMLVPMKSRTSPSLDIKLSCKCCLQALASKPGAGPTTYIKVLEKGSLYVDYCRFVSNNLLWEH